MGEFDFLRNHGFGVVYGAEAVKQKIIELGHTDPTRKKNMNDTITIDGTEATLVPVTDVKHYVISFDADGNEIRTEVEAPVFVQGEEGPVATEYVLQ